MSASCVNMLLGEGRGLNRAGALDQAHPSLNAHYWHRREHWKNVQRLQTASPWQDRCRTRCGRAQTARIDIEMTLCLPKRRT